jgi:hypothetical protein
VRTERKKLKCFESSHEKNGEAGKFLILSSTAPLHSSHFSSSQIKRDKKLICAMRNQSFVGIWSVNNCQNNWKPLALGARVRTMKIEIKNKRKKKLLI